MEPKLIYYEIDEGVSQASVDLGNGYKIQIIMDDVSGNSVCNLYTPQGKILDKTECDSPEEIQDFISISELLMRDIEFWDLAFQEESELVQKKLDEVNGNCDN